jgi:hypothetical protein
MRRAYSPSNSRYQFRSLLQQLQASCFFHACRYFASLNGVALRSRGALHHVLHPNAQCPLKTPAMEVDHAESRQLKAVEPCNIGDHEYWSALSCSLAEACRCPKLCTRPRLSLTFAEVVGKYMLLDKHAHARCSHLQPDAVTCMYLAAPAFVSTLSLRVRDETTRNHIKDVIGYMDTFRL